MGVITNRRKGRFSSNNMLFAKKTKTFTAIPSSWKSFQPLPPAGQSPLPRIGVFKTPNPKEWILPSRATM
jgi:hypothetical protein